MSELSRRSSFPTPATLTGRDGNTVAIFDWMGSVGWATRLVRDDGIEYHDTGVCWTEWGARRQAARALRRFAHVR